MSRAEPLPICHLDGHWLPLREARISPLDRGFLFGDGIYEVVPVFKGRPFRFDEHFDRLARSAAAIGLVDPHPRTAWRELVCELLERNGGGDQYVYVQITRGAEFGRNHAPPSGLRPTVFAFSAPLPVMSPSKRAQGLACVTATDIRWARCDIKSTALLANVMRRHEAEEAGADETILLADGMLREATASTVHVVRSGTIFTPPNAPVILPGTTRSVVEELAERIDIPCVSRPVTEAELRSADEIWLAAATRNVAAVTSLDGRPVGNGQPGPLWTQMSRAFEQLQQELAGTPW